MSLTNRAHAAHAILMVLGWGLFLPVGALIARHFKRVGSWFKLHVVIQLSGKPIVVLNPEGHVLFFMSNSFQD